MHGNTTRKVTPLRTGPRIIPRSEHTVSRAHVAPGALKVLYRLHNAGFKSYMVGGSVRDLLLGLRPKDFDVVTDARPEQVRELFRNCRLIGRRFRLAHVHFGSEIVEVSTFRAAPAEDAGTLEPEGRILRDNVYGDIEDDVWRRDFTANALFYNIEDYSVVDYVGGLNDIHRRCLRLIGHPEERYREDPVRMLRAVRFAVKLGFDIDAAAREPIAGMASRLGDIPPARLFEEFSKMFLAGRGRDTFDALREHGLLHSLFPQTEDYLDTRDTGGSMRTLIQAALNDTDQRVAADLAVTPEFVVAALLWAPMQELAEGHKGLGLNEAQALELAADTVFSRQVKSVAVPRRRNQVTRDIWLLQHLFQDMRPRRRERMRSQPALRAAYRFLQARHAAGEDVGKMLAYWEQPVREAAEQTDGERPGRRPRRRRRRRSREH